MECPKCNGGVRVKSSRPSHRYGGVVRLRRCKLCGHEWRTIEIELDHFTSMTDQMETARAWAMRQRLVDVLRPLFNDTSLLESGLPPEN